MKVPRFSYRIPDYYGDNDWHVSCYESQDLSTIDPMKIVVKGTSYTLPRWFGSIVKLKSEWLWRHSFSNISQSYVYPYTDEGGTSVYTYLHYTRHYSGSTGSNGSTAVTSLGVGVTSTSYYYAAGGSVIDKIYTVDSSLNRLLCSHIRFGGYQSWYPANIEGYPSYPSAASNRGIIVKFKAVYEADLPSDMYSVADGVITWNTSHPIYRLLYGLEVTCVKLEQ